MPGRSVEWVAAIGNWVGALVTALAVIVSAISITQQLASTERQQQLARIDASLRSIRELEAQDAAPRCVRNTYGVLDHASCEKIIFQDDFTTDQAMSNTIGYLVYVNLIYQYNVEYCDPLPFIRKHCMRSTRALEVIKRDEFDLFAKALEIYPRYNVHWDIEGQKAQPILEKKRVEDGARRFAARLKSIVMAKTQESRSKTKQAAAPPPVVKSPEAAKSEVKVSAPDAQADTVAN